MFKQVNFVFKRIVSMLFALVLGCMFLNPQYVLSCEKLSCEKLSCEKLSCEKFILCDGFSYESLPDDYKIPVSNEDDFKNNKYVHREDLRLLKIKYVDFEGKEQQGELVVAHKTVDPKTNETIDVSKEVLEIFKELFEAKYPIRKMSCFYFRNIAGTDKLSWHAYGLAVDINYKENPCVSIDQSTGKVTGTIPSDATKYIDRSLNEKGMIKDGDACHKAFVSRGWEWGGSWDSPKDYMHFQRFSWDSPRPSPKY